MFWWLAGLIIFLPIIELYGLVTVGSWIGPLPTILIVIATGVIGSYLAKREGLQTYRLLMLRLQNGEMPTDTLLDGVLILVGGIFLILPGFLTDIAGFLLIFPYTRGIVKLLAKRWLDKKIRTGEWMWIHRR